MEEERRVIFDTNALITACKFSIQGRHLIEWILQSHVVVVPSAVGEEAIRGKNRYEDAAVAARLIDAQKIQVEQVVVPQESFLHDYDLGRGEKEAICLYLAQKDRVVALVTDDKLAYIVCDRMSVPKQLFLDFVLGLVRQGALAADLAREVIEVCQPRYSKGLIAHSLALLQEVERQCQA